MVPFIFDKSTDRVFRDIKSGVQTVDDKYRAKIDNVLLIRIYIFCIVSYLVFKKCTKGISKFSNNFCVWFSIINLHHIKQK